MQFLIDYGLFLAKTLTLVIAILLLLSGIVAIANRGKEKGKVKIKQINQHYDEMRSLLQQALLSKQELKQAAKKSKQEKRLKSAKKRIFVLDFEGDIRASAVSSMRQAVTAILTVAKQEDEVIVCLDSSGGMVHTYGLAASQLERIKQQGIHLTVIIDKVAASGGYLMACVANKILAAPFAIIGSIGVVAQLPNFHRLLKKNHVDFEQMTAGEFKRTLTVFGENTEKAKQKFQQELEDVHQVFKQYVLRNRPILDIDKVATGEHWLASQALELKLVDGLITSDDYLLKASEKSAVFKVMFEEKKTMRDKLLGSVESLLKWASFIKQY
jgi:serine protease SohB